MLKQRNTKFDVKKKDTRVGGEVFEATEKWLKKKHTRMRHADHNQSTLALYGSDHICGLLALILGFSLRADVSHSFVSC